MPGMRRTSWRPATVVQRRLPEAGRSQRRDTCEHPVVRPVEFRRLELVGGGVDAARALFEDIVVDLVGVLHPGAHSVRANPGDWGIDAVVGQLERGGAVHIWQAKYFPDGIDKSQKAQIRGAYTQAVKEAKAHGHCLESWTLCVPVLLAGEELKWWNGWKRRQKDGVDIDLWAENHLRAKLLSPEAAWIYDAYLADGVESAPTRRVEDVGDPDEYDGALFVEQLRRAGLDTTSVLSDAKQAYFNAELVAADVENREFLAGREELRQLRAENRAIWSAGYTSALPGDAEGRLDGMYGGVITQLREHHTASPPGPLRLHFIHRNGVMHQLVDEATAGWVADYEEVARERAE